MVGVQYPVTFLPDLRQWFLNRMAIAPHLAAAIMHSNVSGNTFHYSLSMPKQTLVFLEDLPHCCQ